jgi:predicted HNH restriction endonuclease
VSDPEALVLISQPVEDEEGFQEGALKLRMHRARERNQALVEKAKKVWLAKDPLLRCECCGFSFKEKYGLDFIEAHHRKPISELDGPVKAKVEDLAPVCANCHRMLHRGVTSTFDSLSSRPTAK